MIGIIILISVVATIARMAKTRGASPWLFGLLAVIGWIAPFALGPALARSLVQGYGGGVLMPVELGIDFAPWVWLALVALYVRFVPGRQRVQPSGKWSCPNCHWLNAASALNCEACKTPYTKRR